jgi:CRP-like cAMP-binding protein
LSPESQPEKKGIHKEVAMFQITRCEDFADGQTIFKEGSFGDWMYVVADGAVEISRTINGKKIIITLLEKGEIFGEVAFVCKDSRSATAQAVGKTTVGIIDRNVFDKQFNSMSGDFQTLMKILAQRLKKTTDALIDIKSELL